MNDVFVGFGVAGLVIDVPAQQLEERVEEFTAKLRFIVVPGFVGIQVKRKTLDQLQHLLGRAHGRHLR